ncbi:hypothetical protein MesoLjLa_56900 [Mesorhizobium sp. L-2-11]|nr:hypothetical protein MesoLjLa_56900 [Mesorhizobium sp. L-2-11]
MVRAEAIKAKAEADAKKLMVVIGPFKAEGRNSARSRRPPTAWASDIAVWEMDSHAGEADVGAGWLIGESVGHSGCLKEP